MELPNPISPRVQQPPIISWEEQLHDHNQKIEEYLQNRVFRGCTYESTVKSARTVLKRLFDLVPIPDPNHPDGHRHILVWEFLDPVRGSSRFGVLMSSLLQGNLAYGTRRRYLTELRAFCDYVVAKPNIPGSSNLTIIEKYGPIALPFTKYDLPVHAQDRPTKPRYALSAEVRDEFYEFLRTEHLPNHPVPHLGAQDYVAIVLQTEIGARTSELLGIRSSGASCDIDWQAGRVRLFGKAKTFSGKRVRTVPLTAFAMEVLRVFEKIFKPMFPRRGDESEYLFLDKDGDPLMDHQYIYNFRKIVELAREAGVHLPEDLRPHDLRRTCATLALEQNPLEYRKVLRKLGHTYPSSAAPYLIATDADVEDEQGDLIDIFYRSRHGETRNKVMPTNWKLRELLKERGVKSASEISRSLQEIGYQLSVQAVCDLLNRPPKMIRLETIEAICNAFYIPLSEFLEVLPRASQKPQKRMRTLQSAQRVQKRGVGPSIGTIDYAGFYPDARKFSSGSTKV